jgi:hypothetical protein
MTAYHILPYSPTSDSKYSFYFFMDDGTGVNVSRLNNNSCLMYTSVESGTTYCRSSCGSPNPYLEDQKCVSACSSTKPYLDTVTGVCYSACPSTYLYVDNSNNCVNSCTGSYPYIETTNKCVNACGSGEKWYLTGSDKICVSSCSSSIGYPYYNDGSTQCIASCTGGTFLYNSVCYTTCPSTTYGYSGNCQSSCPTNYFADPTIHL